MARVHLPPDVSRWIAARIRAFPADHEPQHWLAKRVAEMDALPLMVDMSVSFAIRANGELVQFESDGRGAPEPLDDPRLINLALFQGSLEHPELAGLVPSRPPGARDCSHCNGTGRLAAATQPGLQDVVCYCGGVGWLS